MRIQAAHVDRLRSLLKRLVDLVGSWLVLLFLTPIMMAIAIFLRLESRGPILRRELRRGYQGLPFTMLRFRTTVDDGEQPSGFEESGNAPAGGPHAPKPDSQQFTPIGQFLWRYRLNELPQLINVLRGEMSLVGPRPISGGDSDRLREQDQRGYERRLTVMPGVTGAWQVARQANWDHRQMIQLDVEYAENWSLARDLLIILKTNLVLLRGRPL